MHTRLWRDGKRYRYFNCKPYEHLRWCFYKSDASKYAEEERKEGKLARVTPDHTDGFAVWTYTKTGWEL